MHAHFVLAHPEPQSFNEHMVRAGSAALGACGWTSSVSDLYAKGFDPCERPAHYAREDEAARFDVQAEQRLASDAGTLPPAVMEELALLDRADLLVLQYPMWWHLPPAMLKGWFDRVLAFGEVYASRRRFEHGRFAGKRAMVSVTVGTSAETYAHDGRSGDIDLLLWPVHFTLAYVGYEVLRPFVAYGVEAGLRYSDPSAVEARLRAVVDDFRTALLGPTSARPSPSTAWRSGGRTGASCRVPRFTRRSSGAGATSSWTRRAGPPRRRRQGTRPSMTLSPAS
ncbi:MAG TPA: NAD(P)H-dependent oxidoreductase [Geminicoccus sp.]|jgi:NAD(P)H dehydrogenase (quinone)|uniref:NAD(P)H-dependent oxidoreductase n=1 Tax=Geminicoccus sp. TaxID=2024832 RepID=UPI002E375A6A|nr:NAD(P)H-dependent oxidoreductase [Geminicoccus sp.]HEX2528381.1 NAD(P)H-dependent oxidoreductase [Geminicoccus sp.]